MYPHRRILPSYEGVGHIDTRGQNQHFDKTKVLDTSSDHAECTYIIARSRITDLN
jgi:hypothetical protein